MATQKPSIPKGTRDFLPMEMAKRNYIFSTIKEVYHLYGFRQIETPAMENLSTLLGKYGEEGDKLLFKILNSGNYLANTEKEEIDEMNLPQLTNKISEKGLRYDLTVPFARFVVMHRNDITFPFKRFQIQPVWRADRPQKGRYREFFQCDADIVGSDSLLYEVELIHIVDEVFRRLGISSCIKINNRKILAGIAQTVGVPDKIVDITTAIDKLEKIGLDAVNKELSDKGIPQQSIEKMQPILLLSGSVSEKMERLKKFLSHSTEGLKGIEELTFIFDKLEKNPTASTVELDLTLARGLNYYTGFIIEVKALDVEIGSICGGGRYDNLTGIFGLPNISGVGISFGADRIFDVLNQLNLYPASLQIGTQVMFTNFGTEEENAVISLANRFRKAGISTEVYPESAKMKKQMSYAHNNNIPYVAIVGTEEIATGTITLKKMFSGEQLSLSAEECISRIKNS